MNVIPIKGRPESNGKSKATRRPDVLISTDELVVNDAIAAELGKLPQLYVRNGRVVTVLRNDLGNLVIHQLTVPSLRENITASVRLFRKDERGIRRPAHPPEWAVRALHDRRVWPSMRPLVGLAQAPFLRDNGGTGCELTGETAGTRRFGSVKRPVMSNRLPGQCRGHEQGCPCMAEPIGQAEKTIDAIGRPIGAGRAGADSNPKRKMGSKSQRDPELPLQPLRPCGHRADRPPFLVGIQPGMAAFLIPLVGLWVRKSVPARVPGGLTERFGPIMVSSSSQIWLWRDRRSVDFEGSPAPMPWLPWPSNAVIPRWAQRGGWSLDAMAAVTLSMRWS